MSELKEYVKKDFKPGIISKAEAERFVTRLAIILLKHALEVRFGKPFQEAV